ncbi:MAG: vWA domain-containing protein [Phycisphaerales bacterium]
MTLLAPWAAVIAGMVAGPLLVLLYVLKLRRRRVRISSTMLWERAVEDLQVNEPFRRLRVSVLLLVQLLALTAFVLALGRPAVPGAAITGERVLLMIDASASMAATDDPARGTRFEAARDAAIELIRDLPAGTAVQIGVFGADARTVTGMTTDHQAAIRAVRSLEPTDQPGDLAAAVELSAALLSATSEDASGQGSAVLVLVSDGGNGGTQGGVALPEARLLHVGPPSGSAGENAGIVAASVSRDYRDPAAVQLFVRVQQTGAAPIVLPLITEVDGRVADRRTLEVPAADATGPGSQSATISIMPGEARRISVRIERTDALGADNTARFLLRTGDDTGRVLLVQPGNDPSSGEPDPVAWVVGDVLDAIAGDRLVRTDAAGLRSRASEDEGFAGFGLVVLDRVPMPPTLPVPSLSFGVPLPSASLGSPPEGDESASDVFINWRRTHPAMSGLSFEGVTIGAPRWFSLGEGSNASPLARGRFGPLVIEHEDGLQRRIAVAFEPTRSTWPLQVGFTLFVAQAVEVLTQRGSAEAATAFRTGDRLTVDLAAGSTPTLTGPAELRGRTIGEPSGGRLRAVFAPAPRVGVYAAPSGAAVAAVNLLDPGESALRSSDRLTIAGQPVAATSRGEGFREVWAWFVLAGFVLAAVEWIWFSLRAGV